MKSLLTLKPYFYRYRYRFLLGVVFVSCMNIFSVLSPKVVSNALDMVFDHLRYVKIAKDTAVYSIMTNDLGKNLLFFGLVLFIITLMQGFFMYWMRQTIIVMSRLIEYDLRKDIFKHYTELDISFYRSQKIGDMMARITEDVSKVRNFLGPAILYGINMITLFVFVITSMILQSPKLTLYSLLPLPLLSVSIYFISSVIHSQSDVIQQQLSRLNSLSQEVFSGIRILKSFVHEDQISDYFEDECEDYRSKSLKLAKTNALFFPMMILFIGFSIILTIYFGGREVIAGTISPGTIAEFVIYVSMLTWPVTSLGWISSIIQQASVSMTRINEFWLTKSDIENSSNEKNIYNGEIEFDDVSFTYTNTNIQALKNVSFKIEAGEKVAIVGKTGSGKTTIADLLLRLFDNDGGEIRIDGTSIKSLNVENLRANIAYVPQDVFLFSEKIKDNIRFGNPEATIDEIMQYAQYAHIHDEIDSLPAKYETEVGERGVTLSGGQKQRISIARALIKQPQIIILDDCLSAVDANTEIQISQYFEDGLKDATALIITHRLNPYMKFDKIIVLEDGQLASFGTAEQVIEQNAYFKNMYFKSFQQEAL